MEDMSVTNDDTLGAENAEESQVTEPEESGLEGEENPDTGKVYTQAEIDALLDKKAAEVKKATERKLKRQFERERPAEQSAQQAPQAEKPKADDYKTAGEYIEAKVKFEMAQAEAERQLRQSEITARAYEIEVNEKLADHLDDADDLPGFDRDKFQEMAAEITITRAFEEALADLPNAPKVLEYLALNPKEFIKLDGMSAVRQVRTLGEMAAGLKQVKKAVTDQSPRVGGGTNPTKSIESMNSMEFTKHCAKNGELWAKRALSQRPV